jgi:DDE superfamily endonuclease
MSQHPYRSAQRVFLIIDNGSSHRGKRSIDRLTGTWPSIAVVHTPIHASWLNQAESTSPSSKARSSPSNDFTDLDTLAEHLLAFGRRYEQIGEPFEWKFTRDDLNKLQLKTDTTNPASLAA